MKFQTLCIAALLFATMVAIGSASAASCSNATLKGVAGTLDGGFNGSQPEVTLTQFTADGKGNIINGTGTNSLNGVITTGITFTGTYSVAKNCTGSYTVKFQNGSTASGNFVLDNMKKGAQTIRTDSGFVKSGVILAQGAVTCSATGKAATFAANLTGTVNGVGSVAVVGQALLDGKGSITGTGTFSLAGSIFSGSISGNYTENTNCTGMAQITPQGLTALNFNFLVVNGGKEILMIETDANTTVSGTMQQ